MSVQTEIDRIIGLVSESHEKVKEKGGATTTPYLLANLPGAIDSIPKGTELPTLTTPGTANDALSGKQFVGQDGTVVTGNIPTKTASNLSASGATVTVPAGYYAAQATKSVATATQATPSVSIDSAGKITATATQTAGYVSAGTKTGTKQLTTQAAKTVTPTKSSQTAVAKNVYTTGAVTVAAIPDSYVQPSGTLDVTENGTHDVKNYASVNVNVAGSGGGSGGGSVETCTVTIEKIPANYNLIYQYVENGEVRCKSVYFPMDLDAQLQQMLSIDTSHIVKNSFIVFGKSTIASSIVGGNTTGDVEIVGKNGSSFDTQTGNTCGHIFKVKGDCSITMD